MVRRLRWRVPSGIGARLKGQRVRALRRRGKYLLFDFEQDQPVTMWMKNTYLPLDMLFIRADGTVARIAADTEPLSTRTISSGEPVLAVLELNAGTAARLGLRAGRLGSRLVRATS